MPFYDCNAPSEKKKSSFYTAQPRARKGVLRAESNFQLDKRHPDR